MDNISTPEKRTALGVGIKLSNFLKQPKAHKWCYNEWFYSNIDRPIFLGDNDFTACLQETYPDIKAGTKLTKFQWAQIRRSLGKPRRCSSRFFEEERVAVYSKREKIRQLQHRKVKESDKEKYKDIPDKIPAVLIIGTKVTAHIQGGLFVGQIDAVDHSTHSYRIRFDRPGLGTHTVPDYEVLSNEECDMMSKDNLMLPDHTCTTHCNPTNCTRVGTRSCSTPTDSSTSLSDVSPPSSSYTPNIASGYLGGYPVTFLRCIVKMSKLLHVKGDLLAQLKHLNGDIEKKLSFKEEVSSDIQLMYATLVLDLDKLNKMLQYTMTELQAHCKTHLGAETLEAAAVKTECMNTAADLVDQANQLIRVNNEKVKSFVTELTALLVQIERLSHTKNPCSMPVLNESIKNLRAIVHPSNLHSFQDNIEVPLAHIQARLKQDILSPTE